MTGTKESIGLLKEIQDSSITNFSILFSTEPKFIIDARKRKITLPSNLSFLAVRYDHQADTIYFEIDRYVNDVDLSQHTCIVQFVNGNKYGDVSEGYYRVPTMDIDTIDGKIIFGWTIENCATKYAGDIEFSIRFYSIVEEGEDVYFTYNLNTTSVKSTILDTLQIRNREYNYPTDYEIWAAKITEIVENIEQAEESLTNKIEETEQYLVDTVNQTMQEVDELLELSKQQAEFAKEQANLASEQIPLAKEQVALAAEKVRMAEEQAAIASQKANNATQQAAIAENYSNIAKDYAVESKTASDISEGFAEHAEEYALKSQSYAVGGTAIRDDEVTDNAKYYYEQFKSAMLNTIDNKGDITAYIEYSPNAIAIDS